MKARGGGTNLTDTSFAFDFPNIFCTLKRVVQDRRKHSAWRSRNQEDDLCTYTNEKSQCRPSTDVPESWLVAHASSLLGSTRTGRGEIRKNLLAPQPASPFTPSVTPRRSGGAPGPRRPLVAPKKPICHFSTRSPRTAGQLMVKSRRSSSWGANQLRHHCGTTAAQEGYKTEARHPFQT
jgi:hypothetical protein